MKVLAHRGASAEAPENTLAAVRRAWDAGADGLETDLRVTADGNIVLMHDASTRRTTGTHRVVAESTLDELSVLDAGGGEPVPTLRALLAEFPDDKELYLDIKCGAEIIDPLRCLLEERPFPPAMLSFVGSGEETLRLLKVAFPAHRVYWNRGRRRNGGGRKWSRSIGRWIDDALGRGLDGLGLDVRVRIDEAAVSAITEAGLGLFAWTVNDPAEAERLRNLGAVSLATDDPRRILATR